MNSALSFYFLSLILHFFFIFLNPISQSFNTVLIEDKAYNTFFQLGFLFKKLLDLSVKFEYPKGELKLVRFICSFNLHL